MYLCNAYALRRIANPDMIHFTSTQYLQTCMYSRIVDLRGVASDETEVSRGEETCMDLELRGEHVEGGCIVSERVVTDDEDRGGDDDGFGR